MLPFSFMATGTYTNASPALPATIALSDKPDYFMVEDITNWGANGGGNFTALPMLRSWWYSSFSAGEYSRMGQVAVATTAASLQATAGTSGGFTFVNASSPPTFASLASTTIDKTTWVVLMTNTGSIAVGDYVRIINPVGMLQAGGIIAQVTAVSANTSITLGYIATAVSNGANFTANASSSSILKFYRSQFYPKKLQIMHVSQATQAKVYFAEKNNFTVGELVDFIVPTTYGMIQLNSLTAKVGGAAQVITVTNSATESSITLNLDTSGFTAFAYPTSAGSVGAASPPICMPAGSGIVVASGTTNPISPPQTNLADAFDNLSQYYMIVGANVVGASAAVMQWSAWKADYSTLSNA